VQSDSAPEVDGDRPTVALNHPEPADDDPVRRLLGGPPDPVRQMDVRHWLGISGLVAAIAVVAFVLPPLTSGAPPATQSLTAPRASSWWSPSAAAEPATGAATSPSPAAPTTAHTTGGSSGTAAPTSRPAPTAKATTRALGTTTSPFHAITVQAEASTSTLADGASVVACATCEGGARVRYLGRVDIHTTVSESGTRDLTIVYETDGTRSFDLSINDGTPIVVTTVTSAGWTTPQSVTVSVSIPAGSTDIGLFADAGNAPDFDAITIS